ncbi:MAG TPA: SDR family oxidoreductase [Anaerolineae bacterium]|nr:SDR family oxidoreductase [Anaerolineae bacterium]
MDEKRFSGKVALVTGAGRGMGKATALILAAGGAKVVVNDVNETTAQGTVDEIRANGGEAFAWVADVADEAQVERMIEETVARYGTIHILVNNAGILRATYPLETIPVEEWDLMMAVNVRGVFLCTKHVLPLMKKQRYGKIINVSSSAGRSTSTFGGAHYTTSKAAVLGLTRHTAREAAPYNINVNAVAPGSMDTEMVRELASPEHIASEEKKIPLRRLGTAQDEANLVAFLASDESSYITGATIDINGGDLMI